jgi:hypothetical protein
MSALALAPSDLTVSHPAMPAAQAGWLARGALAARSLGPYAAVEILLPGGTLIAFLLWLYRRHRQGKPLRPAIHRGLLKVRHSASRLIAPMMRFPVRTDT